MKQILDRRLVSSLTALLLTFVAFLFLGAMQGTTRVFGTTFLAAPAGSALRPIDSDSPDGPLFGWEDVSTGIDLFGPGWDNALSTAVALGFSFPFGGKSYTHIIVSTNGAIMLGGDASSTTLNVSMPDAAAPNAVIAPYWDDLTAGTYGTVKYVSRATATEPSIAVQWAGVKVGTSTGMLSFQAILRADGGIRFNYDSVTGPATGTGCTVGIEDETGTIGVEYLLNGAPAENLIHSGLSVEFVSSAPPAAPTGLVQAADAGGTARESGFVSDSTIHFRGSASDPDAGQKVALEVEILPFAQAFHPTDPTGRVIRGPLVTQGAVAVPVTFDGAPYGNGSYRWRARTADSAGSRSDWVLPAAGLFTVDITEPFPPANLNPGSDLSTFDPSGMMVNFSWQAAVDPSSSGVLRYEFQLVASDNPMTIIASQSIQGTSTQIHLPISRAGYSWTLRASDEAGNTSPWSAAAMFRLLQEEVDEDGNSSACGSSASAGVSGLALLAGLAAVAAAGRRRA